MAERKAASNLLDEVTCSLCLDVYQEPKRLPCDHVYCRACLEDLAKHSRNDAITCPECRNMVQIGNNDVATAFPTAFQINRLKELYAKEKQQKPVGQIIEDNCQLHQQPFALYCETCDELICRDCLLAITKHKHHKYGYIAAIAEEYRKSIAEDLESKQQLEGSLATALAKVSNTKKAIQAQGENLEKEIDAMFQLLYDKLLEEKTHLKQKVYAKIQHKLLLIASQEDLIQKADTELKKTINLAKKASQEFSNTQLVLDQKKVLHGLESAVSKLGDLSLEPMETPDIQCRTITPKQLEEACRPLKDILFTMADPHKCTAKGKGLHYAGINKPATIELHLADSKGEISIDTPQIEVQITSIKHSILIIGRVFPKSRGQYMITYESPQRGRHSLSIKVNGIHISDSPFPVYVSKPPQTFTVPVTCTNELSYPAGLSWNGGKLYVGECNANRVLVFDHALNVVQTIEHHGMLSPNEITVDKEDNVYSSTGSRNILHKFDRDGKHLKQVGGFSFSNGNCISCHDELYVCDTLNSKIQVYDTDLNLRRTLKLRNNPYDVVLDKSKNFYISHATAHKIQVLAADGRPLYQIGKKGSKPGELNMPISLQISGDLLYVTEFGNSRVSVFRTSGEFVTTFGEGHLSCPEGIAIDEDGFVYVTSHKKFVFVF